MISAKIIADSINKNGDRITTYELEYPRFIHAEFMTHRLFSRNAASSRAIPVERAIELIEENTAMPIHWGKNQPGMSAKEECTALVFGDTEHELAWAMARDSAIEFASAFSEAGYHKQIVNRLLEPYSHIKVVCTATEFDNFFYLRCHPDAQPEIQELAAQMWEARRLNEPVRLGVDEWHLPYFRYGYWISEKSYGPLEEAIAISASCCAQVSYRRLDDSLEKAQSIYKRLIESKPAHASPFEHQASPMNFVTNGFNDGVDWDCEWVEGVTHLDRYGHPWSGNLRGWIQHRQMINGNYCFDYQP